MKMSECGEHTKRGGMNDCEGMRVKVSQVDRRVSVHEVVREL